MGRGASYLHHDRDHAFDHLGATAKAMGIEEVRIATFGSSASFSTRRDDVRNDISVCQPAQRLTTRDA